MCEYIRIPLKINEIITLTDGENNSTDYIIVGVIGYGGSSIVYKAKKCSEPRTVILKEFYPKALECEIHRNNGILETESTEQFKVLEKAFCDSYRRHLEISEKVALNNTSYPLSLCKGCSTVFITMAPRDGDVLSFLDITRLHDIVIIIIKLSQIIKKYHEAGYLHLDIKPSNIFKDLDEPNLYMFDFDSLCTKENVIAGEFPYSYTEEWAAYELKKGSYSEISEATDIYSIGAVFYWLLFDKQKHIDDDEADILISNMFYDKEPFREYLQKECWFIKDEHPDILEIIVETLSKTLCASVESRYRNADELLADLYKLEDITRTIPKCVESVIDVEYQNLRNRVKRRFVKPFSLEENKEDLENWKKHSPYMPSNDIAKDLLESVLHMQCGDVDKANKLSEKFASDIQDMMVDIGFKQDILKSNAAGYNPDDEAYLMLFQDDPLKLFHHYAGSGNGFYFRGDFEKAVKCYDKSLELLKTVDKGKANKNYLRANVFFGLGLVYKSNGEIDKSQSFFEEALKMVEDDIEDCNPLILKLHEELKEF